MSSVSKRNIFQNFSSYAVGNGLGLAAGLLSFPLFARTLTLAEYGLFSLFNVALSLLTCLSKGGVQNTINRYWQNEADNKVLVATSYSGVIICFLLVTVLTVPGFYFGLFGSEYSKFGMPVLAACYLTVFFEVIRSVSNNVSIIQKKALQYSSLNVLHRYLRIFLPFIGLLVFENRILGIATGFIISSFITTSILLYRQAAHLSLDYDNKLFLQLITFGFPLMLNELIDQLLNFCDRFFLAHYLDASAVGIYSAAFNLSNNIQILLLTSMSMTTAPLLLEKFNTGGFGEMKRFLRQCMAWYCLLGGAVIALVASIGPELLIFLASSRYREAGPVMLPILLGAFFYGLYSLSTYTLFFRNKTKVMLTMCGVASLVNILANWLLVPRLGIMGAAIAAFVSYLFLGVAGIWMAYHGAWEDLTSALSRLIPALVMAGLLNLVHISSPLLSIMTKTALGFSVWSVVCYLLLVEIRTTVKEVTSNICGWLISNK